MTVEVEYTDEFGEWWNKLDESEQESVDAVVQLLEEHGPHLNFHIVQESPYRNIAICASCAYSTKAIPIGCFMLSIQNEMQFY